jgi:hypothetical protein
MEPFRKITPATGRQLCFFVAEMAGASPPQWNPYEAGAGAAAAVNQMRGSGLSSRDLDGGGA